MKRHKIPLDILQPSTQDKTTPSLTKNPASQGSPFWQCLPTCLLFLVMVASCTSSPHLIIFQDNQESIDLREWPTGYAELSPHAHPRTISPETMEHLLRSLYYRESVLFSFLLGTPKHLFTDYQIDRLAGTMSKAFDQALPQEVVAFRVRSDADSSLFTSGFSFVQGDELHMVLEDFHMPDFQTKNTIPQPNTHRIELVPRPGQRLFSTKADQKGTVANWIVIQVDGPEGNPQS